MCARDTLRYFVVNLRGREEGEKSFPGGVGQRPDACSRQTRLIRNSGSTAPCINGSLYMVKYLSGGRFSGQIIAITPEFPRQDTYQQLPLLETQFHSIIREQNLANRIIRGNYLAFGNKYCTARTEHQTLSTPQIQQKIKGRLRNITKEIPNKQDQQKEINITYHDISLSTGYHRLLRHSYIASFELRRVRSRIERTSKFYHHLTFPRDRMIPQDTIGNYICNQIC